MEQNNTEDKQAFEERPLVFTNKRGQRLFGVLHLPASKERVPVVVMAHGFTDDKTGDNRLFVKFARVASRHGLAVLRFDFAGSGDSEGDFSQVTINSELDDLLSAVDYVEEINANIFGYKFKWNPKHSKRLPTTFSRTYNSVDHCITRENFREFVDPALLLK